MATGVVAAQNSVIEGTIVDKALGEPLPGVNVYLEGTDFGSATDLQGQFRIETVPTGRYALVARLVGYETFRENVTLEEGDTKTLSFNLAESPLELEEVVVRGTITGGYRGLGEIPGSVAYLGPRELSRFSYNDIHRVLREIPGVNIQEEDGSGLRANIGFRGTGVERSSKITVMEDGVLIAPAPYAAPAAYYFPTVGRMQGVEVRKGSSQVKYGPYTTGGALNLISTQIPTELSGHAELFAGGNQERTIHAHVGDTHTNFGYLIETYQARTDGFKELASGGDTGFDKKDYLIKLRVNTNPSASVYQSLTFKADQTSETSNETYLGLTETDFDETPLLRYAGSQMDLMETDHEQYQLRHVIRPSGNVDITTTLYRNEFARNWYKLDGVRSTAEGDLVKIGALLNAPEAHAQSLGIVTGETSPNDDALDVKSNNRSYYAQGIESILGVQFGSERLSHDVEVGLRFHEDQIDRFQWVDSYRMDDGVMKLTERGTPGTESNRIETARALASFAQYRLKSGALTVTPGLRFEHITIEREDYGKEDPERTGVALAARENTVDVLIPGIGFDYTLSSDVSAFAGVHKGFAPPGSTEGAEPESSINYEMGVRFNQPGLRLQGVGFFNDYGNLLGTDLAAGGGTGSGNTFNGGEVNVIGLELSSTYDIGGLVAPTHSFTIPFRVAYTFTKAQFQNSFESDFGAWGTVEEGDRLPYTPEHQVFTGLGLEKGRIELDLSANYVGRMRTRAGQGEFIEDQTIDGHLVFDVAGAVDVTRNAALFARVKNLTDEVYVVSRRPAGLRPGHPRTVLLGVKVDF